MRTRISNCWLFAFSCWLLTACNTVHEADSKSGRVPVIFPDYSGITIPANIAPMNFEVDEHCEVAQASFMVGDETVFTACSNDSIIEIDADDWQELLHKAEGKSFSVRVIISKDGKWIQYTDIENKVAGRIDPYLAYRLLYPGYEFWNEIGIYQRNLTSFEETPIAENKDLDHHCLNCHTFANHDAKTMMLHVRGKLGGTMIVKNGKIEKVNPSPKSYPRGAVYPYWSTDGRFIAFSSNDISQSFHSAGMKKVEVYDKAADLMVYDVDNNQAYTDSLVFGDEYMETFPCFSPDGRKIYFCRAQAYKDSSSIDSLRYGLYSIEFNPQTHRFSNLKCLIDAPAEGHSISFPRVSPDGKWLMYTQSNYGNFSIWHKEADLYLLNLQTGSSRRMDEVCSDDVESYHDWSSDGEWFVFSSKRMDGLWARPFFAHFDGNTGKASKPFLLPQENPRFYDTFQYTYNIPELVKDKVEGEIDIEKAIMSQEAIRAK